MQSWEVFREVFKKKNPKEISNAIGVSLSLVYKWSEPYGEDQSGSRNPLDRVALLIRYTKERRIIEWLCNQAGGFFLKDPKAIELDTNLSSATNQVVQNFADMLMVVAKAAEDGKITTQEAEDLRKDWERLKSCTEGFVLKCESSDFEELRKDIAPKS
ncbi:MAG: phage regulatory CII family protein [Verrucomicrobiota bacterium]